MKMKLALTICSVALLSTSLVLIQSKTVAAQSDVKLTSLHVISNEGPVAFSPDGSQYTVQKNRDLYLVRNGSEELIASNVASAQWNSDGTAIVYAEASNQGPNADANLWSLDVKSKTKKPVGKTDRPFRFFVQKSGKVVYMNQNKIQSFDLAKEQTNSVAPANAEEYRVSPDGNWVAYENGNTLSLLNEKTGESTVLSQDMDENHWDDLAWKSDSSELVFLTHQPNLASIQTYNSTDKVTTTVYSKQNGVFAGINILNNGDFVYQSIPMDGSMAFSNATYEVLSPQNKVPTVLFTNGMGLRLSPDGHKITFMRDDVQAQKEQCFEAELNY